MPEYACDACQEIIANHKLDELLLDKKIFQKQTIFKILSKIYDRKYISYELTMYLLCFYKM
jgi:hypothetical protein